MVDCMTKLHRAWYIAAITFVTLISAAAFRSTTGVLLEPLENEFGWTRNLTSLAVSLNLLMYGLTAPFAAALMERFGIRKVVMSALTSVGLGALGTIWINAPWQLVALWGVVVGIGTGSMALVFAASVANRWFVQRRGIVVGGLTAASATGQLIFLPGLSHLAESIGWKSVSITVACGAFVMVPMIAIFLKERPSSAGVTPYGADESWQEPIQIKHNAAREAIDSLVQASKVRDFWYLAGSFFVCGLSTSGLIGTHFIPAAHDHGMAQVTAASLLAMVGVFDVIGTLFSGWLTDRIDPRKLLFFYYFLRGLSLFLLPSILFSNIKVSTLVFVIFYGLDWVATVPPTVMLCRAILGPERGTVIYGWVFAAHQIGGGIAALGAAIVRENTGSYATAFYASGIMCVITAYLVLRINREEKKSPVSV